MFLLDCNRFFFSFLFTPCWFWRENETKKKSLSLSLFFFFVGGGAIIYILHASRWLNQTSIFSFSFHPFVFFCHAFFFFFKILFSASENIRRAHSMATHKTPRHTRKLYKLLRPSVVVCWHGIKNQCVRWNPPSSSLSLSLKKEKEYNIQRVDFRSDLSMLKADWRGGASGRVVCKVYIYILHIHTHTHKVDEVVFNGGGRVDLMMATAMAVHTHQAWRATVLDVALCASTHTHTHTLCIKKRVSVWPWRIFFFLEIRWFIKYYIWGGGWLFG